MAGKSNGSPAVESEWARAPPPPGTAWERCSKAFYNPEDNSCLGRTPQRWAIVLVFYAIFYAVLAAMFTACMAGLFYTLDVNKPAYTLSSSLIGNYILRSAGAMFTACMAGLFYTLDVNKPAYTLSSSLIGDNPGVSYRPFPENGFILWYHAGNISESHPIVSQLNDFLQPHTGDESPAPTGCSSADEYGFPLTPCFFIKLNKIYGWIPDFYDASALPADMPDDLKSYIVKLPVEEQKQVWVSCWEENENSTSFEYPWGQGLPESFFPYVNTEGYRVPLVAVKMVPQVKKLITVRCRAWAKNIVYNKSVKEPRGYARIQFYVDQEDAQAES